MLLSRCRRCLTPSISSLKPKRSVMTGAIKEEGDISAAFASLSNAPPPPLPPRFAVMKAGLIAGQEDQVRASWERLLGDLKVEIEKVKELKSNLIPQINFSQIDNPPAEFARQHKEVGVAIIRGVVPESQAASWKEDLKTYINRNPQTKAFPADNPVFYELYWSPSQVQARGHPNFLKVQRFLMSHWHSRDSEALISAEHPMTYVDRLRIRRPGDMAFVLGPHIDGGSCERWEPEGYGRGGVYDDVFQGQWEKHDPFESSQRLPVVSDLYNGSSACSIFRMYQGWLSMSHTAPNEGTLLVNPLFSRATAYCLLRPFFSPKVSPADASYLEASNWQLESQPTSLLQGASLGHGQELNNDLHPHLELANSMIHVPTVRPGDYIAWHCDTIHAVDSVHRGKLDSSVLYIPTSPLTVRNAEYLSALREAFKAGTPGIDFPGGKGESEHVGRATPEYLLQQSSVESQRAMGLTKWNVNEKGISNGQRAILHRANEILGFE